MSKIFKRSFSVEFKNSIEITKLLTNICYMLHIKYHKLFIHSYLFQKLYFKTQSYLKQKYFLLH